MCIFAAESILLIKKFKPKIIKESMKKSILMVLAVAGMISLTACGNKTAATAEGADSTAVAEAAEADANKEVPMADIVAKAKAEGANWSVDEWKAQFRLVAIAIKPMMVELDAYYKKIMSGEVKDMKTEDIEKEGQAIQDKYADITKLLDEFNEIAEGTTNGKTVSDDKAWGDALFKELGIPDFK